MLMAKHNINLNTFSLQKQKMHLFSNTHNFDNPMPNTSNGKPNYQKPSNSKISMY